MNIGDILTPDHVILDLRVPDKRRLLDELARRAGPATGVDPTILSKALQAREQLGSTGMGGGIAIPHARLPSLTRASGLFARLRPPMDFDAVDGQRVDLVFLLLLPGETQGDNLNVLACVARRLRAEAAVAALRKARDAAGLYGILTADADAHPHAAAPLAKVS